MRKTESLRLSPSAPISAALMCETAFKMAKYMKKIGYLMPVITKTKGSAGRDAQHPGICGLRKLDEFVLQTRLF
jgi:hypothetical protein